MRVLVIEDSESDFRLIERSLRERMPGVEAVRVVDDAALRGALARGGWDVVLSDYSIAGMDFGQNLDLLSREAPHLPVILVSGSVGEEQAVSLVRRGIWDFVLKDNLVRLSTAVERAIADAAQYQARAEAEARQGEAEEALRIRGRHS